MYEWLKSEIAAVKEPMFHIVDGPADQRLRKAIETTELAAPKSYKRFALELGNCRLYRVDGDMDGYHVEVLASMHEMETPSGERWLWIGAYRGHRAYFRPDLLRGSRESPVFEWYSGPSGSYPQQVVAGFEDWLTLRCGQAKKKYLKGRWKAILAGPPPFTPDEQSLVAARKKFRWKLLGVAKNGDLRFQIRNGSSRSIPYLSVRINHRDGSRIGGVMIKVIDLAPGKTAVFEHDCYKSLYNPAEIVPADYGPLGPEDRGRIWELSQDAPRTRRSKKR